MKSCSRNQWLAFTLAGLVALLLLAYAFQGEAAYSVLPLFFLLLCPLMMLMGGHGDHDAPRTRAEHSEHAHHIM